MSFVHGRALRSNDNMVYDSDTSSSEVLSQNDKCLLNLWLTQILYTEKSLFPHNGIGMIWSVGDEGKKGQISL